MSPGFPRKAILALLWIVPTVTLTSFISARVSREKNPPPPPQPELVRIPVQIIEADQKAKVIYVDLEAESVPEPSSMLLLPLSSFLLFRRRR